jgi:hypothetical protein
MSRTKGAENKPKAPPKEVLLSEAEKLQFIAELIYEIAIDETNKLEPSECKEY